MEWVVSNTIFYNTWQYATKSFNLYVFPQPILTTIRGSPFPVVCMQPCSSFWVKFQFEAELKTELSRNSTSFSSWKWGHVAAVTPPQTVNWEINRDLKNSTLGSWSRVVKAITTLYCNKQGGPHIYSRHFISTQSALNNHRLSQDIFSHQSCNGGGWWWCVALCQRIEFNINTLIIILLLWSPPLVCMTDYY